MGLLIQHGHHLLILHHPVQLCLLMINCLAHHMLGILQLDNPGTNHNALVGLSHYCIKWYIFVGSRGGEKINTSILHNMMIVDLCSLIPVPEWYVDTTLKH
jgi:hypothetical protein